MAWPRDDQDVDTGQMCSELGLWNAVHELRTVTQAAGQVGTCSLISTAETDDRQANGSILEELPGLDEILDPLPILESTRIPDCEAGACGRRPGPEELEVDTVADDTDPFGRDAPLVDQHRPERLGHDGEEITEPVRHGVGDHGLCDPVASDRVSAFAPHELRLADRITVDVLHDTRARKRAE